MTVLLVSVRVIGARSDPSVKLVQLAAILRAVNQLVGSGRVDEAGAG